jgi:hypothetical protein
MDTKPITDKSRVITAAALACVSNISNLTNDRIQALTGGHGMVNIAVHTAANVIAEECLRGNRLSIEFADSRTLPVEDAMAKAIGVAKQSGADGANAALIVACIMYLAGSKAQVGIPAGNRKLGATARMLAGVDRCGVAAIPTAKMNNKISGFPAVMAIYQAMMEGKLTEIDGRNVPLNIAGGPLFGHSALGEDIVWPQMAENGARIGTQAMLDAMAGAAIHPHPFTAAILGAAAILEIIHPDAEVPESMGPYGRRSSAYLVGKTAAATAGLPETLHIRVTGEEYETAQVIGDIGLILKDIGGPAVIGMMAMDEIFAAFAEGISGSSASPVAAPLGHVGGYAIVGMKALTANGGNVEETAKLIAEDRIANTFEPDSALLGINLIARKAEEMYSGIVTKMLIEATDPARAQSIYARAAFAYEGLSRGLSLENIVKELDDKRLAMIEKNANAWLSGKTGQEIGIKVLKAATGARRTSKLALKYLSFDLDIDIRVRVGDKTAEFIGFAHEIAPKLAKGECPELAWAAPLAGAVAAEVALVSSCILNIVVPAAVACATGRHTPEDAARIAESAAWLSAAIPGGKAAATRVGKLAREMIEEREALRL